MRKYCFLFLSFVFAITAKSQNIEFYKSLDCQIYINESYNTFERNKFDIVVPNRKNPVPLIIFIHGGGFRSGDKKNFYSREKDIQYFLENNIAVATINYRFYKPNDSLGVKVCLSDVQNALQYIKHNAKRYNIDKSRIGCYGISAGAGSSLFLAFHDDMAIPGDTTMLGESTRIKCAGAISTQATYDVFAWQKYIPGLRTIITLKRKMFYNYAARFYGYENYNSLKKNRKTITKSLNLLSMIDKNDPPIYLMNLLKETFPKNDNIIQHHKNHALKVAQYLNKNNIKNYCFVYKRHQIEKEEDIKYPIREFLIEQLQ